MILERFPEIMAFSIEQKRALADELWEEIDKSEGVSEVDLAIGELLDQRFAEYEKDPSTAVRWEDLKKRMGKA
ncbi:MAG: addiction module protein [Verrucomicrobiaceae bacterium]|nr:addiction module protein [Verrucomicrobiaceae bacterium]